MGTELYNVFAVASVEHFQCEAAAVGNVGFATAVTQQTQYKATER